MTPINKILQVKLRIVRWKDFLAAKQVFQDWRTLLKEAAIKPMTAKELFMGDLEFLVWIDSFGKVVGGGWISVKYALEPTILRLEWPNKFRARLITTSNPGRYLDMNNLEMARKLLAWLVLEVIIGTKTSAKNILASLEITQQQCRGHKGGRQNIIQRQDVCSESLLCGNNCRYHH